MAVIHSQQEGGEFMHGAKIFYVYEGISGNKLLVIGSWRTHDNGYSASEQGIPPELLSDVVLVYGILEGKVELVLGDCGQEAGWAERLLACFPIYIYFNVPGQFSVQLCSLLGMTVVADNPTHEEGFLWDVHLVR